MRPNALYMDLLELSKLIEDSKDAALLWESLPVIYHHLDINNLFQSLQRAESAFLGSHPDSDLVTKSNLPESTSDEMSLALVCIGSDPDPILAGVVTRLNPNFPSKLDLALACMKILSRGLGANVEELDDGEDLVESESEGARKELKTRIVSSLVDHWPMIWACVSILLRSCVESHRPTVPGDMCVAFGSLQEEVEYWEMVHPVTLDLLATLIKQTQLYPVMVSAPDLVSLLIRIYGHETRLASAISRTISASNVLMHVLSMPHYRSGPKSQRRWPELPRGLDAHIPKICLQRIVVAAHEVPNVQYRSLLGDVSLLVSCTQIPHLHRYLISKNSISTVLNLMRSLTPIACQDTNRNVDPDVRRCLISLAYYLKMCFDNDGFPSIIRALESRLLVRIFKCAYAVVTPGIPVNEILDFNVLYSDIVEAISSFLVYRPVAQYARKSIKTVATLEMPSKMETLENGPLMGAWTVFKDFAHDRLHSKWDYDNTHGGGLCACSCANPTVSSHSFPLLREIELTCIPSTLLYPNANRRSPG